MKQDRLYSSSSRYLGKPAQYTDRIIKRRVDIASAFPKFTNQELDLVDVGCGNGASSLLFADRFRSVLGIDVSSQNLDEFRSQIELRETGNVDFKLIDIEREKLNRQFDRLISFEVIEHLESEDSVKNISDLLSAGGLAVISVPNKSWIFETHGCTLPDYIPWNRVPGISWLPQKIHERIAKARIYTKKRISDLLEKHGFKVIEMKYVTAPLDVLQDGVLKSVATEWVFDGDTTTVPFLSTSIIVFAQKI